MSDDELLGCFLILVVLAWLVGLTVWGLTDGFGGAP